MTRRLAALTIRAALLAVLLELPASASAQTFGVLLTTPPLIPGSNLCASMW
ncbi:MAG TPA: hypothetical protein VGK40_05455 [Verrucomicrobiae bacterium]